MKTGVYIALFLISFICIEYFHYLNMLSSMLSGLSTNILTMPSLEMPILYLIHFVKVVFSCAAVYRMIVWIRTRSIAIPETFTGLLFFIGLLAIVLFILPFLPYLLYAINGAVGISGIPLAFAIMFNVVICTTVIIFSELSSLYKSIKVKELKK